MSLEFDGKKFVEVSKVDGVVTLKYEDDQAFVNGIKDEVDADTLKKVFDYKHKYLDEAVKSSSEQAKSILEKDKDVERVVTVVPDGIAKRGKYGEIAVTVTRDAEITVPGKDEKIRKTSVRVRVKDAFAKPTKSLITSIEEDMTKLFIS